MTCLLTVAHCNNILKIAQRLTLISYTSLHIHAHSAAALMFQWYGLTLWSLKERDNIFSEDEIAAAFADKRWSTRDMLHRVKAFYNIHRLTSLELLPTVCELQINTNLSIAQRLTWSFNDIKEASINSSVRMRAKHLYLLKIYQQLTHVVQGVKCFYSQ